MTSIVGTGQTAPPRPRLASAGTTTGRAKAFEAAIRHSRRVRTLRWLFPVMALAAGSLYFLPSQIIIDTGNGEASVKSVQITSGDLKMINPRMKGETKSQGKYDFRADSGMQSLDNSDIITLVKIEGELLSANGEKTFLTAPGGIYDSKKEEMNFNQGADLARSSGLKAKFRSAMAYFSKNLVVSQEPVEIRMDKSTIFSDAAQIFTQEARAIFTNNVRAHLERQPQADQATPAASGTFAGFSADSKKPIDITSDQLEIEDHKKTATFRHNVIAVQGETNLKTEEMVVTYTSSDDAAKPATQDGAQPENAPAQASSTGMAGADVRYVEARGNVVITSKDNQTATGDNALFDMKAQTVLLTGNVVVSQGNNHVKSDRMLSESTTGRTVFQMADDAAAAKRRLQARFVPKGATENPAAAKNNATNSAASKPDDPNNLMPNFGTDPKKPIDVVADSLEVEDQKRIATFIGNVDAVQGGFSIRSKKLVVTYVGSQDKTKTASTAGNKGASEAKNTPDAAAGSSQRAETKPPAQPTAGLMGGANADIKYIEATDKVLVTTKDNQTATGDRAFYDVKANTVLMTGDVVVTRDKNIIKGDNLLIDTITGKSTFQMRNEAGEVKSRLKAYFVPKSQQKNSSGTNGKSNTTESFNPLSTGPTPTD